MPWQKNTKNWSFEIVMVGKMRPNQKEIVVKVERIWGVPKTTANSSVVTTKGYQDKEIASQKL